MKILSLLFLCVGMLFASEYELLMIRAQASIFPKIILLDKDIASKVVNNTVTFCIVYDDFQYPEAVEFQQSVQKYYNNKLGSYNFDVELLNTKDISNAQDATAYYIFNTKDKAIKELIGRAISHSNICFSYSPLEFEYKALISLFVKEKTYIYLNKACFNDYNINFMPIFYKIVKIK